MAAARATLPRHQSVASYIKGTGVLISADISLQKSQGRLLVFNIVFNRECWIPTVTEDGHCYGANIHIGLTKAGGYTLLDWSGLHLWSVDDILVLIANDTHLRRRFHTFFKNHL